MTHSPGGYIPAADPEPVTVYPHDGHFALTDRWICEAGVYCDRIMTKAEVLAGRVPDERGFLPG